VSRVCGAVSTAWASTDSAQIVRLAGGGGSSPVACACTWWRTLDTAAAPRPQLSHKAAPSASWLTPKPACSSTTSSVSPGAARSMAR
jgi:hypothetical protein